MLFYMSKKKNSLVVAFCVLITILSGVYFSHTSNGASSIVLLGVVWGVGAFALKSLIQDYKVWIGVDENGIKMYRRGKIHSYEWKDIKRLQYQGIRALKIFDVLVIHTTGERLLVEYTFENYKSVWACVKEYAENYSPQTCIDQDIPF